MKVQNIVNKISAANDGLILPKGCQLTLITEDGTVLQQGTELVTTIFDAMKSQVVRQVFSNIKPLSKQ